MTVIAGLVHHGRCYIAGDGAAWSDGDERCIMGRPKVRRVGGIVYGVSGDVALCTLALTSSWVPRWRGEDPKRWLADALGPALRDRIRGIRGDLGLLVGIGGTLWSVDRNGGPTTWDYPYGAQGNGRDWALGSLATSHRVRPRPPPRTRLRWALEATAQNCSTVGPPWRTVSI